MTPGAASLVSKLRLAAGQRALLLNAPAGYLQSLGELPTGVQFDFQADGVYDFVQLFVRNQAELEQLGHVAFQAVQYDGLLWVCYPKQAAKVETDLNRDRLWKLIEPSGLRPVTQIALDAAWSALRFRPAEKAGK
jgi:hypothetical protein